MAEFALGLTKTAVEGTLVRVKSAIDEEAEIKEKVQNDLVFITEEFEMMRSFLYAANTAERAKNPVVRTWVRQLRDLAFDVEDCVEFVVHLDTKKSDWWWRVVPSCIAPPLPVDVAVAEIQQLKARVEDVSKRNARYNLLGDDNSMPPPNQLIPTAAVESSSPFDVLSQVWQAAGKLRGTGDLKKLITSEGEDLQVISLWQGSCSTGAAAAHHHHLEATYIIKKAYDDPEICQEFKSRAWIKRMHPFDPDEFLKTLLALFYPRSFSNHQSGGAEFRKKMRAAVTEEDDSTKAELMRQVTDGRRYLLVLEGISTVVDWEAIRMYLPDSYNGSRIVVSTEHLRIAILCTREPYQVSQLTRFSDGQFLCAFSKKGSVRRGDIGEFDWQITHGGLQSKQDWDIIRKTFFSELHASSGSHIIVITNEKSVAKHSVDDKEDKLLKVKRLRDRDSFRLPLDPVFFVGRQKERCAFREQLWGPGVISLWGIAGVGKSALVRKIYDEHILFYGREAQRKYSWVDVPHPFRLMEFSRRLLLGFYSKDLHAQETAAVGIMEGQDTIQACCHLLQQYVCVIVIDGLRSTHDWDSIKAAFLSEPTQSSRIIVITTEQTVATHCAPDKRRVHNITGLDAKDALRLFKEIAGGSRRLASKMDRVKLIMDKCGGLPQVISVIAQEISKINNVRHQETALATILGDICDDFMGKLETDPRFNELKDLFSWMQSYFDACSDSLKPCIFYLSVFSADKIIRRRRLLRRWIAEGYSRDTSGGGTVEENGEKLFADLVESSIIQLTQTPSSNDEVDDDVCQVNGFFREYIISQPMEDNLVFALEGCCSINSQRAGQHLTIRNSWDGDEIVFKSIDFTRLRSLTVFGAWRSFFISNDINMELLRVLDLEDTDSGLTDPVLEQIGKQLPRLKFLSVRGCKDITHLPDSLGGLRQLQTLDIRHTKIAILPHSIIKLVKLQYVRVGTNHVTTSEGGNAGRPSSDEDDFESTSSEDSLSSEEDGVGTVDRNILMRTDGEGTSRSQPPPAGDDGMSTNYDDTSRRPQANDDYPRKCRSKACNAVVSYSCSWWSKKKLCASQQIDVNFGVEAPAAGIGKLTALQTFGVVNVGGARGKSVLKDLKKLTQLHKLGVCGINRENWQDLCCNILGHGHLKSLSVHLDKDDDGATFFSSTGAMFSSLPKNLKSLKLYNGDGHGNVLVPSVWIKQLGNLRSLTKQNLGLRISTQGDIDSFEEFPDQVMFRHICVKPTQDCELRYYMKYRGWHGSGSLVHEIDCGRYKLAIAFGFQIARDVEVLVVHCSSTESSLKLSGLGWLESLKEVVLKGSYSEAVKQHLQQQVDQHEGKPVLKLEDGESHQSQEPKDPAAPSACCHTCASCCFNGITSTCKYQQLMCVHSQSKNQISLIVMVFKALSINK